MTLIDLRITRMTHVFSKLLEYFSVKLALSHSYNKKKNITKVPSTTDLFFLRKNLSSNKSIYKIWEEMKIYR